MSNLFQRAFLHERRKFWRWVGILGVMFFLLTPTLAANDFPPLPIETFWSLLKTTHTRITELATPFPEAARPALEELATQWDAITAVELSDGTILPLDTRYLAGQLRAEEPNLPQLTALFAALLATRETWPQGNFGNTDLAKLDSVLRQPEFQWQVEQPNPIQKFIQTLLQRLNNAYIRFLQWLFPDSEGVIYIPVNLIFTILASILIIIMFLYILRGTWGNLVAEAENAAHGEGDATPLTAEAARQRARQLSQAGDHRTAIRYLYLASLLLLEERGLLRYDRSLTNRETLRSVANRPDLAAPLKDVVETFDRVWYGYQEVDQPAFEQYAERVDDLRAKK